MPDPNEHLQALAPEPEPEGDFVLDPEKPLVLLLGWVDHEGILSSLKATGGDFQERCHSWSAFQAAWIDGSA